LAQPSVSSLSIINFLSFRKKCEINGTTIIVRYEYNFYSFDKMVVSRNMYQVSLKRGLQEVCRLPGLNIDL
jgi:hypothetical protein